MTLARRMVLTGVTGLTLGLGFGAAGSVLARPEQRTDSRDIGTFGQEAGTTTSDVVADSSVGDEGQGLPTSGLFIGSGLGESLSADDSARETRDRLVTIFSAMEAQDAGRVIALLDDDVASDILSRLTDRKVAQILATMPEQRAAELTRLLLTSEG